MNIFFLDEDPVKAAQYHNDKHVKKMIIESAQLLFQTMREISLEYRIVLDMKHFMEPITSGREHIKWLRQSYGNYSWLSSLAQSLNNEWKYRYDHDVNHGAYTRLVDSGILNPALDIKKYWQLIERTPPYLGVEEDALINGNPVESYRQYYRLHKSHLAKWTKRGEPAWWSEELL